MKTLALLVALPVVLLAQGVTPVWDIQPSLKALSGQIERLRPLMDEIKVDEWTAKDAPPTYADLHRSIKSEASQLARYIGELAKEPDRITPALEAYFRLQSLDRSLQSMAEGVRRYQNPALADLVLGVLNESENNGSRLRGYLVEIVSARETEFRIADTEAQRCRGMILRQRPAPPAKTQAPKPGPPKPAAPKAAANPTASPTQGAKP